MDTCQTCGEAMGSRAGKRGRASVYCSPACRQKAYRARQAPAPGAAVHELIADIERRVKGLAPQPPATFYSDVTALSASVGQLRRIARVANDVAGAPAPKIVTPAPVTETPADHDLVRSSDESTFAALVEPHRRELQVHCYRMLGSYDDSEDLVQETFLLAWRGREGFEGRASFRAWLYRIATNACLDFLRRNDRRPQRYEPMPGSDPGVEPPVRVTWLQPYPDELAAAPELEPDAAVVSRETMELVFLVAIQHLPPRQRAVLILRDVLGWPASETGRVLDLSVASVNSALQRARPTLREHLPQRRLEWAAADPTEEERVILRRYLDAALRADFGLMVELLSEDALITMPPAPIWISGRKAILDFVTTVFDTGSPQYFGRWRHVPTRANGLPAAAGYVQRPGTTVYRAQVLDVLRIEGGKIVEIMAFEPHLFPVFGLPLTLRTGDR